MNKVLIVEDSQMVMKVIKHVMSQSGQFVAHYASSFAEAKSLVGEHQFVAGLIDLNLPDAPNGEVVDYTLQHGIPSIVLTGTLDNAKREQLLSKGIVDYVTKEGRFSYEYALGLLQRLLKNRHTKVLVVDDSKAQRSFISSLLKQHLFQVLTAEDGVDAINVVLQNPDLKMLITDYNMPNMDGFELVQKIRSKYEKSDLVIIGLSSEGESGLSARFIKNGANDFLKKPFNHEEFYCRINQNIEFLELVESIRDAANRDDLTNIYNRKYFFAKGAEYHRIASEKQSSLAVAVLDLDNFKEVNFQYGNDIGDLIIKKVAEQLQTAFGRFLVSRSGDQEFFAIMPGLNNEKACSFVERVRQVVSADAICVSDCCVPITFSAGICNNLCDGLDAQVAEASKCLIRAKEAGGDLVIGDDP